MLRFMQLTSRTKHNLLIFSFTLPFALLQMIKCLQIKHIYINVTYIIHALVGTYILQEKLFANSINPLLAELLVNEYYT